MRILITGGAGFIGSHLADRLFREKHQVIAIDNLITGNLANIQHLLGEPAFEFIEQDITEPFDIHGSLDLVLHFASPASPIDYLKYPIETLRTGSLGTQNALEVARHKDARFLLASTSEVYGDPTTHPQHESYFGNVSTTGPRSCYDEAKRYAEAITMAYCRTHQVDTRIVRIFNTYGERMRLDDGRVVPNFIGQALRHEPLTVYGEGDQTRSFCYVSDLVDGILRLAMLPTAGETHYPVNLGNPNELTILEFAYFVNTITDNPGGIVMRPEYRIMDDPNRRRPDITRAKQVLGWEPKVSLTEGLQRTVKYFEQRVKQAP